MRAQLTLFDLYFVIGNVRRVVCVYSKARTKQQVLSAMAHLEVFANAIETAVREVSARPSESECVCVCM